MNPLDDMENGEVHNRVFILARWGLAVIFVVAIAARLVDRFLPIGLP